MRSWQPTLNTKQATAPGKHQQAASGLTHISRLTLTRHLPRWHNAKGLASGRLSRLRFSTSTKEQQCKANSAATTRPLTLSASPAPSNQFPNQQPHERTYHP